MTRDDQRRIESLFEMAYDLSAEERKILLDREVGSDRKLRAELEAILSHHDAAHSAFLENGGFGREPKSSGSDPPQPLERSADELVVRQTATPHDSAEPIHMAVEGYRLIREIGRGGCGVVYLATQKDLNRRVALKVINPGVTSRQALRRFEHETQILGRLQHPVIAQIYGTGTFDNGAGPQPYFAMEFIDGRSLTVYVKECKLNIRQRLELVAKICQGVHHAHQKGVIHRDLKPPNILVDAAGHPKILDFGVARATETDIQLTTLHTDAGQIIGTVPYMSPEQAGGDPHDLDSRSDVYALGVIAYELLAERLPYDVQRKMIHEAVRVIREDDPTPLSSINRVLRGDVEVLIGKALAKEKDRRYQSADEFASDIERYLQQQPIAARPPSTWYQFSKFARRNRALVGGAIAVFVVLAGGLIGTAHGLRQAIAARDAEARERKIAERRQKETQQVADFQAKMLGQVDPTTAGALLTKDVLAKFDAALAQAGVPADQKLQQTKAFRSQWTNVNATNAALDLIDQTILKPAVEAIDKQFKDQPLIDAQLRQTLATRYEFLGLFDSAKPLQERALATRRRILGEDHPETLHSMNCNISLLQSQGKWPEAEALQRKTLPTCRRVLGEDHPDTLISIGSLGSILMAQDKLSEAEPLLREALEKNRRVLGEDHQETLTAINAMGFLFENQQKLGEAESKYRDALKGRRQVLGEEHPDTLISIDNLAVILRKEGKLKEAEGLYREALGKFRRVLGEEHNDTLISINNLGVLLRDEGRPAEAEPLLREALEKNRRILGPDHPSTLRSMTNLGGLLQSLGKSDEAETYYREAVERHRRVLGDKHIGTLTTILGMGLLLQAKGRLNEAESCLQEVTATSRQVLGQEHPLTLSAMTAMGGLLQAQGKNAEAVNLLSSAEPAVRKAFTDGNTFRLAQFLTNLGKARAAAARTHVEFTAAETNLLEAHAINVKTRGEKHEDTRKCAQAILDLYTTWDKTEPGKGYDSNAAKWREKLNLPGA